MNTKRNNSENKQFREFFIDEIKDIYWAEKHLSAALKKMKKAATSPTLASSFEKHIAETDGQIERLKRYSSCSARPRRQRNATPWRDSYPRL